MGRVVNLEETTKLCKAIAVIAPAQKFEADTPAFWAAILASVSYADARQAVINLGARVPFMAPADIIAEVKAIRAKRLEGVDRLGHLAETPAQWRAIIAKVADGETEVPPLAEDDAENKRAIESMMRERLQADPGYSGLITKNPAHPLWRTLRGPRLAYDLCELAEYLPGIEKYRPKRRAPEEVGLGRNVALFDLTRKWAYKAIRSYWGGGLDGWNRWLSVANSRSLVYNGDFKQPLGGREVWHIARSVAKWTWRNTTAEGFSAWQAKAGAKGGKGNSAEAQAEKGRASGKARTAASENKRASAVLMRSRGILT